MVVFTEIGKVAFLVPIITAPQLSVAVGVDNDVISHCAVSVGRLVTSAVGATLSLITTAWVCEEVLPFPSSYVHVTVVLVVIGKEALCVPVIVPAQLSVAVGAISDITFAGFINCGE